MELLVELIFRGLIMNFLGLNVRYFFLRIIGKNVKRIDLTSGNKKKKQEDWHQDLFNALVGLIVICAVSVGIAYLGGSIK